MLLNLQFYMQTPAIFYSILIRKTNITGRANEAVKDENRNNPSF